MPSASERTGADEKCEGRSGREARGKKAPARRRLSLGLEGCCGLSLHGYCCENETPQPVLALKKASRPDTDSVQISTEALPRFAAVMNTCLKTC